MNIPLVPQIHLWAVDLDYDMYDVCMHVQSQYIGANK